MQKHEGTELFKKEEVKGTPFTIITDTEKNNHFGSMGNYRITEFYEDKAKLKKDLVKITWDRLIQVILIINENHFKLKDN